MVTQRQNGEIVAWADVQALTRALHHLANADELRREMGKESRRRALQFGWPALAARYLELCERVAASSVSRRLRADPAPQVSGDVNKESRA